MGQNEMMREAREDGTAAVVRKEDVCVDVQRGMLCMHASPRLGCAWCSLAWQGVGSVGVGTFSLYICEEKMMALGDIVKCVSGGRGAGWH